MDDRDRELEDEVKELNFGEATPRRNASMLLAGDDPISWVKPQTVGLCSFSELHTTPTGHSVRRRMTFGRGR